MIVLLATALTARGAIEDFKQVTVDFTNFTTAAKQATWSDPEKFAVSKDGLGWDGEASSVRDGWIQTKPLALGLSWRPPFGVNVRVAIQPAPAEITLNNGQKMTPYGGDAFVRYSADLKHWSSWQALQTAAPLTPEEKKNPGRLFNGTVRVSYRDRANYGQLLSDYSGLDVPWKSDEEAAVQWIISRDADFFSKQIPFIGYVEFLFEGSFHGGQRIRSFHAEVMYGMSGLHSVPKDESVRKDRESIPWRFKAKDAASATPWAEKCLAEFESIKAGMSRSEVEGKFKLDGGLQGVSPVRYIHPDCPNFKVNVEFDFKRNAADQNRAITGKEDKVIRVSKPYLERPFMD